MASPTQWRWSLGAVYGVAQSRTQLSNWNELNGWFHCSASQCWWLGTYQSHWPTIQKIKRDEWLGQCLNRAKRSDCSLFTGLQDVPFSFVFSLSLPMATTQWTSKEKSRCGKTRVCLFSLLAPETLVWGKINFCFVWSSLRFRALGLRSWSVAPQPQNHLDTRVKCTVSRSQFKDTKSVFRKVGPEVCCFDCVILSFISCFWKPDSCFVKCYLF